MNNSDDLIETISKYAGRLLMLLLTVDFLLLALNITMLAIHGRELIEESKYSLYTEWGYGETFQHIKELAVVIILFMLVLKKKNLFYLPWALIFLYLGLDDSFQIHERLGELISNRFSIPAMFYLRPIDFGELLVTEYVGLPILVLLVVTFILSTRSMRKTHLTLILLLALLVFFGVVMDMVAIIANSFSDPLELSLNVLEDYGEMVAISLILWYVFRKGFPGTSKRERLQEAADPVAS